MAQASAIIGVLTLSLGLVWLYIRAASEEFSLLYIAEFFLLLPVFLIRHWSEVKIEGTVTLVGLLLVIAGYSHGW